MNPKDELLELAARNVDSFVSGMDSHEMEVAALDAQRMAELVIDIFNEPKPSASQDLTKCPLSSTGWHHVTINVQPGSPPGSHVIRFRCSICGMEGQPLHLDEMDWEMKGQKG